MATSSFDKKFVIDNEKAVDSFIEMISNPPKSIKIDDSVLEAEKLKRGEEKFLKMLSR